MYKFLQLLTIVKSVTSQTIINYKPRLLSLNSVYTGKNSENKYVLISKMRIFFFLKSAKIWRKGQIKFSGFFAVYHYHYYHSISDKSVAKIISVVQSMGLV